MKNFRTYYLAVEFYKSIKTLHLPGHLRNQMDRAASSIVLNLAEGWGRKSIKEKMHFYQIAFGSLRECQSILDLSAGRNSKQFVLADKIGGSIYKLLDKMRGAA